MSSAKEKDFYIMAKAEADLEENRKHRAIIAIGRGMVPA